MDFFSDSPERAEAYRILGSLFLHPPDSDILDTIHLYYGIKADEPLNAIADDFQYISLHLPPFETIYVKDNYNGVAVNKGVHNFYFKHGIMVDEELGLPSDHLAVELLFMSYLVENDKIGSEIEFFEKHLLNWATDYLSAVAEGAKTEFYKTISNLLKEFLVAEYQELVE